MPHELHNGCEVNSGKDEASGEGVTKIMEAAAWDPCPPDRSCESGFHGFDR